MYVNLPNPITQTINLLLKINENVVLKEKFETFQLINYYKKNTYNNKTNTFYCFQCSKWWKIIWSSQNWNREK